MEKPLTDDLWKRRGISILWNPEQLNDLCTSDQVISLRQLRWLCESGWRDDDLDKHLIDETTLVVAGLESCVDALSPAEATEWLEEVIYKTMVAYQTDVADGGTQAALVFWFVNPKRLKYEVTDNSWIMHCAGEYKNETIPIGRCLFNGAASDLKYIQNTKKENLGLYHPRIS